MKVWAIALVALLVAGCGREAQLPTAARPVAEQSLASQLLPTAEQAVRAEFQVLVDGNIPPAALASQAGATEELQRARQAFVNLRDNGISVTAFEVGLEPVAAVQSGRMALLVTTERAELHLSGPTGTPQVTIQERQRRFTFQLAGNKWSISKSAVVDAGASSSAQPLEARQPLVPADAVCMPTLALTPSEPDLGLQARNSQQLPTTALGLFNKSAAAAYARQWARTNNPAYVKQSNDCTNFVSQCMKAGGWSYVMDVSPLPWFYVSWPRPSWAWVNAHNFWWFTSGRPRGALVSRQSTLVPGDVVQFDWDANGQIDHTMVVTSKDGAGNIYLSGHTDFTLDKALNQIVAEHSGVRVYLWMMYYSFS